MHAAGCPWAISPAKFGPVRTPVVACGTTEVITSDIRIIVSASMPFDKLNTGVPGAIHAAACSRIALVPCEGTAIKTASAPVSATSRFAVATNSVERPRPGR